MNYEDVFKGIFSDSNNMRLGHKSEDIDKKGYFQNFTSFNFFVYKLCIILCIGTKLNIFSDTRIIAKMALIS